MPGMLRYMLCIQIYRLRASNEVIIGSKTQSGFLLKYWLSFYLFLGVESSRINTCTNKELL